VPQTTYADACESVRAQSTKFRRVGLGKHPIPLMNRWRILVGKRYEQAAEYQRREQSGECYG
jgi:hypothetical protein